MRIVMILALGAMLTACAQPAPEPTPSGPAPLPAHPIGDVTKPTELPAPAKSASAGVCASKSEQNSCN